MDLTSKNMYDTFKGEIWKELGPLDPNWFEVLTAQTSPDEGNVSDQDDLCANQEGHFKATSDKPEVDSQLFSTPKVFRHRRVVTPQTEDEQSFTTEQDKGILPWTATQSPHIFAISKQGVNNVKYGGIHPQSQISFDLLVTPQKSPTSYAKQISESLGAQINPDFSWTSSLNTPPAVPSTLILSKNDKTSPCPASISAEKDLVFVRKLFPSLSNPSTAKVIPAQNNEFPPVQQGAVSPEVGAVDPPDQSHGVWRHKPPDASEDGEIRSTVASVLDGAENSLSIYFANSGSALRKVKPDRIRPKQIFPTKEHGASSPDVSAVNNPADEVADLKNRSVSSDVPASTTHHELSQWSPLSFSEIAASAQRSQSDSDVRPPAKVPASGFTKKKRTFVYTVASSKPQVQSKESRSQTMDSGQHSDVKQMEKTSGSGSETTAVPQQGSVALENLPAPVQAKDLDMSQLCKEFAQDFSQTSDSVKMRKVTEDTQNHFSPLACLSAVKHTKQKTKHKILPANFDGVSNSKTVSLTNEMYSVNEGATLDSGFQSAVAEITPVPSSLLIPSCSLNPHHSHLCSKGDIHGTSTFPPTNKQDEKVNIDVAAVTKLCSSLRTQPEEGWTQDPRRKSDAESLTTSKQLPNSATVNNSHYIPLNEKQPEKTSMAKPSLHTSGFKTASNKGIHISSANLERAKLLFEETESGKTLNRQPTAKSDGAIKQQMSRRNNSEFITSNSNQFPSLEGLGETSCQLTESQKADVTELCTLLEEAESQFEFTQFKTGGMTSPGRDALQPKTEKELDADLLTGIDFDDSFSSDADRHPAPAASPDKITANEFGASDTLRKVHLYDQAGLSSSVHMSEGRTSVTSTKPLNLHRVENTETSKQESKDPSVLGVTFKSAGGNILTVSKAGLSKARMLFADLEKLTDLQSTESRVDSEHNLRMDSTGGKEDVKVTRKDDLHVEERVQRGLSNMTVSLCSDKDATESFNNSKMVTPTCQSGFHMASGKSISISAKYVQQAHALFKDCDMMEPNGSMSVKEGKSSVSVSESISKNNLMESSTSDEQTSGISQFGNVNARLLHHEKRAHPHNEEMGGTSYNGTLTAQKAESHHRKPSSISKPFSSPPCTASKHIDSSAVNELSKGDGFCTASGKKVTVSTESMIRAEYLLNEHRTPEDTNKKNGQKVSSRMAGQLSGGKGVAISSAALKKAKAMMRECHEVEDDFSEKAQQSQMPIRGPPPGKAGFVSASGEPVALSSAALLKAKALFSDIDVSTNSDTKSSDDKHDWSGKSKQIYPDLKPPVEENVQGSQCSLTAKSSDSLSGKGCVDSNDRMSESTGESKAYLNETGQKNKTFLDLMVNISEEPGNGSIKVKQKANPQNGGFQTASGKTIPVSSEGLKKAKTLLSDCGEVEGEAGASTSHFKVPVPGPSSRNGGFVAASGKQVAVSSEALRRAKALFSDIGLSADFQAGSDTKTSDKKEADGGNTKTVHCGFKTAGEKIHVPQKKLIKAKHLKGFESVSTDIMTNQSDVDGRKEKLVNTVENRQSVNLSEPKPDQRDMVNVPKECGNACIEGVNKCEKQITHTFPPPSGGFQTASGKDVAVSSEALRKAEALLGECEGVENESSRLLPHFKAPVAFPSPRNNGFVAASGKQLAVSSEALQRAKALFSDVGLSAEIQAGSDAGTSGGKRDVHCGFKTAQGEKVHVSQKSLLKAKHLLKEFHNSVSTEVIEEADCFTKDFGMDGENGMNVRQEENRPSMISSGEKKKLSDLKSGHSTEINISTEPGNGFTEDGNKQAKQKSNALTTPSDGFHTASGKEVTVSSEALRNAKTLSECEEDENKIVATSPHFKIPGPRPSSRNCGFLAASGKKVSVSDEALRRAKALFSDISASADLQAGSDARTSDDTLDGGENPKMFSGFTTAGGAKVNVSQKNLLKAKRVLEELESSPTDQRELLNFDLSKEEKTNHITPSEKNTSTNECASLRDKSLDSTHRTDYGNETTENSSVCFMKDESKKDAVTCQDNKTPVDAVDLRLVSGQEKPNVLNCDVNQSNCSKDSSLLNFQSLHLTGCTETQQDFLAREAIDCTKALLQDESIAGQSFSPTSEFTPVPGSPNSSKTSSKVDKGKGKRSLMHDDLTAQPPLKRRLLEQFDKTVDGSRSSTLQPMKSCPNVLKDRGVFKYSVSLHPNVTRPHRSGRNLMEQKLQSTNQTSTSGDDKSAHSKTPAFVPPFIKTARTDACGNMAVKDKTKAPAFVPPFKKQKANVQENSELQQENKDEELHPFVKSSENDTFVPPAKKTDSAEDVAVLTDATSEAAMKIQELPVAGGSASSDAQSPCVDGTLSTSTDLYQNLQNTELARDMQDMRIRKKKRQTIRPLPGSLFLTKTSGVPRIPLRVAVNGKAPAKYTPKELYGYGVHWDVCEITSATAESFRFNLLQFIKRDALAEGGGVQLGDGGWLIPGNDGTAGKEEFYRALCDTPGVDPKLLSEAWAYNHYRWIVWKQASMEKSFPETMGSRCLTPEQVLLQLKYRYDVEVDHSRRPALRKILEKDDTAAKTLVLCVSEIVSTSRSPNGNNDAKTPQGADAMVQTPAAVVRLTDGWYSIKAQLDEPLTAMLRRGRLAVGGKLMVHGAQLLGSQDACPPLEAPESVMLKICANSSRPVRWDVKLGFYKDPRPFLLPVSCLFNNGGPVGCVDIVILRSYPIQWMERKSDGGVVFRSVRAEEKEARRYNAQKQKTMEVLFAKIQAEFEREEKGNIKPQRRRERRSHQDLTALQEGEELYEAVGDEPAYLQAHLSERQLEALHTYQRSLMEKKQTELQDRFRRALEAEDSDVNCPKRDVTPVWRLCVADSLDETSKVYQLNLWRPSSDLQSLLKEGRRYKVYNLATSEGKKRSGTENVQLTGTKKTQFQDLQASSDWLSARFQPRVTTSFVNLENPDYQPLCGEVDVTGYVISVVDGQGSSPAFYLVDGGLSFVKVRCFSSFSQSGLDDVVKPCVLLALSNLQLRGQSMCPTPVVYAGDLTVFSTNPKEVHLQESLGKIKTQVQCQANFFQTAEEKLSHLIQSGTPSCFPAALQPQTPTTDTMTRVPSHKPVRSLGSFTPVNRNPPAATPSSEKDPRSLKRKRALDYLSHVPSPPPLSHLNSLASPSVNKTFNPPRRSGTPSTLKTVQTPRATESLQEKEWVKDEELAMIDTQALHVE